jgi:2-polyprenyl-6-methoxyphenol hydroxylase-like FAD-dependent oxidoreductase
MDIGKIFYTSRESRVQVTSTYVRTRRHLIPIDAIRAIETRRAYALHAWLIGGGIASVALVFWPELAPMDRAIFLGLPTVGIAFASQFATLKVSFDFKDEVIRGWPYRRVMLIRHAIEQALFERAAASQNPRFAKPNHPA